MRLKMSTVSRFMADMLMDIGRVLNYDETLPLNFTISDIFHGLLLYLGLMA